VIEILITPNMRPKGTRMLEALAAVAPVPCTVVTQPGGKARVLVTYGPGDPARKAMLEAQRARGGQTVIWDMGYFATKDFVGGMRMSAGREHPQHLLDLAPADGARWARLGLALREDADPKGPIVLVGMGPKTRAITKDTSWEMTAFNLLRKRFPRRGVIFRPKPRRPHPNLPCRIDATSPIERVLKGASLVVCKHSNVAVDAVLAGIPVQAEDGAVKWLDGKPYSRENRLDFLQRLMYFNWRADEATEAWAMILKCL
jgi:hypothetical protein